MGTVANSNVGFKGTVSSADTPQVLGNGSLYSVEGKGDLKATAGGTGDRAVTVAVGAAWGDGVLSKWTSSANLNCAANSTGSTRYDTVVIRRTWTPAGTPTGTATLMVLTGGSSVAIAPGRLTDQGVTSSDQPIALVPVPHGSAVVGTPIDLRCWTGEGGGLVAEHIAALQYLGSKGTRVQIGPRTYTRLEDSTGTLYWDTLPTAGNRIADAKRTDAGDYSPGVYAPLVAASLPPTAPAGLWLITWVCLLKNSPASHVKLRGQVGAVDVLGELDIEAGSILGSTTITTPYIHASGGALLLTLSARTDGGIGNAPPGSRITAVWQGPA